MVLRTWCYTVVIVIIAIITTRHSEARRTATERQALRLWNGQLGFPKKAGSDLLKRQRNLVLVSAAHSQRCVGLGTGQGTRGVDPTWRGRLGVCMNPIL